MIQDDGREVPATGEVNSSTWGSLTSWQQDWTGLEPHDWDNMTASQQRDFLISIIPCSPPDHRTGTPRATGERKVVISSEFGRVAHIMHEHERKLAGEEPPPVTPPTPAAELVAMLRKHHAAMTPGEWLQENRFVSRPGKFDDRFVIGMVRDATKNIEDARGIAYLRNNITLFANTIEGLMGENERLKWEVATRDLYNKEANRGLDECDAELARLCSREERLQADEETLLNKLQDIAEEHDMLIEKLRSREELAARVVEAARKWHSASSQGLAEARAEGCDIDPDAVVMLNELGDAIAELDAGGGEASPESVCIENNEARLEAARNETWEAAAKVAEEFTSYTGYRKPGQTPPDEATGMYARGNANAKLSIAAALRARSTAEEEEDAGGGEATP
jgi:hypothetical protein